MNLQANYRENKIGQYKEDLQVLTSLEVTEMVGRRHDQVLRDITTIIGHLSTDHKSVVSDYFMESSYEDKTGRTLKCFDLTKKGCELYGTRMTGEKGTQFAVAYIERFNSMEQEILQLNKPSYQIEDEILRAERWIQEQKEKKELLLLVEENREKVFLADAISASEDSISIKALAGLLTQNGIKTGQNKLFEWLRENNYLVKKGEDRNLPIQEHLNNGFFEIKIGTRSLKDGSTLKTKKSMVTSKGQNHFIKKFLKYNI